MTLALDDRQRAMLMAMGVDLSWLRTQQASDAALIKGQEPVMEASERPFDTMQSHVRGMTLKEIKAMAQVGGRVGAIAPNDFQEKRENHHANKANVAINNDADSAHNTQPFMPPLLVNGQGEISHIQANSCLLLLDQATGEQAHAFLQPDAQTLLLNILRAVSIPADRLLISTLQPAGQALSSGALGGSPWLARCTEHWQTLLSQNPPALLVITGRMGIRALLQSQEALGKLREQVHTVGSHLPCCITYAPDYLLRNPLDKARAWHDWLRIQQRLMA